MLSRATRTGYLPVRSSHAREATSVRAGVQGGAVRIVRESGKSIAEIARDLDINAGTLGNWVARDRGEGEGAQGLSTDDVAELKRLRSENAQLRMERDVLKRSVALWVKDATK
jgi:transposase-like protein